jgi:DNA repair protein RadC
MKKNVKRGTRKIYGGTVQFDLDDLVDLDETLGNIAKLSEISEEQLYNSFYHTSAIASEKANIKRALKMMKDEATNLKKKAKTVDDMVTRTVKTNTIIMDKAVEMARKVKNTDRDEEYERVYDILLNKWNTVITSNESDDGLINKYFDGMKKYKSPKPRTQKKK